MARREQGQGCDTSEQLLESRIKNERSLPLRDLRTSNFESGIILQNYRSWRTRDRRIVFGNRDKKPRAKLSSSTPSPSEIGPIEIMTASSEIIILQSTCRAESAIPDQEGLEMGPIVGGARYAFWEWICLKHVGRIETGTTPSTKNSANYGGTLPFFKPTDLDQGMHVEAAREFLSKRGEQLARVLPPGSTLVTCIGATIGKTGLSVKLCATNQQINSIIPDRGFEPILVYYQASSPFLKGRIKSGASATTLPILNKSKFGELPFALCSLAEQRELVRLVEERIADIERSERYVIVALRQADALRQSILKIAFSGQLAPRDPNDEPASVLLDRIRAERELLTQRPRHRKTGKRIKAKITA